MLKKQTMELIATLPALVSLIASFALALSVARELGLLAMIDIRLVSFLSLQDIIVNALTYVPLTIFFLAIGKYFAAIYQPTGVIFNLYNSASRYPWLDGTVFILGCLSFYLFIQNWPLPVMAFTILCFGTWTAWISKRTPKENWLIIQEISQALLLIIFAFLTGVSQSIYLLSSPPEAYEVTLVDSPPFSASIIFSGDNYILLRDNSESVRVIAQARVKEIRRLNVRAPTSIIPVEKYWRSLI